MDLKPTGDLHELFRRLVDIESVSMHEAPIADAVEETLAPHRHLEVTRLGNSVIARTHLGRSERVVIAGHLDTVPVVENLPSYIEQRSDGDYLVGRGTCDMKGGIAVALALAVSLENPVRDVTWAFYECEEIAAEHNGLEKIASWRPDLILSLIHI